MNEQETKRSSRLSVVVLGMHRSGTSAVTGTLNLMGCDVPATLMKPTPENERGYFESSKIKHLNEAVLSSVGSSWNDWLAVNPGWYESPKFDDFKEKAKAILAQEIGDSPFYTLKDPRICRLLPFWQQVLSETENTPVYVHIHRNPLEVAASLQARDHIPAELGALIWLRHVLEAEAGTRGEKRVFVSFAEFLENWAGAIQKMERILEIRFPRSISAMADEIDRFLSTDLRHFTAMESKVLDDLRTPEWIRTTYRILESWADRGESGSDYPELDRVRNEVDQTAPSFSRLIKQGLSTEEAFRKLQSETTRLNEENVSLQRKNDTIREELTCLQYQLSDVRRVLSQIQSELEQRKHEAEQVGLEKEELKHQKEAVETQLKRSQRDLSAKTENLTEFESRLKSAERSARLAKERYDNISRSTFWRLTAPLRKISDIFKRPFR